jgi:hypothetical protein
MKPRIAAIAAAMLVGTAVFAAEEEGKGGSGKPGAQAEKKAQQPIPVGEVLDVEELRDDLRRYTGQAVKVAGEIDTWMGPRAFIIESGGIVDDHVLVVAPKAAKGLQPKQLKTDDDLLITGTVRTLTTLELERELGWDLEPQLEAELTTRPVLVADTIAYQAE